jgi:hypothetical protein
MMSNVSRSETYAAEIARFAQALALAHNEHLHQHLAEGSTVEQVKLFTDGNLDKRFEKLQRQTEFVADAFAEFDELLVEFMRHHPLSAYDTGTSDGERCLRWLERTGELSPEQRDYIICQRARHAVEESARSNRLAYVRFQELWSTSDLLIDEIGSNPDLRIYLNPIRIWSRFETQVLLDADCETPADVLFFPVQGDIRTALLEPSGYRRVRALAELSPCMIETWVEAPSADRSDRATHSQLIEFCRDLAEMGLVAFG